MITPANGRILLIKLSRNDVTTKEGILLPGQTLQEESLLFGEVIDHKIINDGVYKEPIKKGQKIFYSRYSATMVTDDDGKVYYILSDLDIMAYATS